MGEFKVDNLVIPQIMLVILGHLGNKKESQGGEVFK